MIKDKIINYLTSIPEINKILREVESFGKLKKIFWGLIKLPYILWIITITPSIRKKKYYNMISKENVFQITKYNENIYLYLPTISLIKGKIVGDYIQKIIFLSNDFYESDELWYINDKYLQNVKNMIDVGANIGNHTIFYSCIAKFEKIFSFEPVKKTFSILEKNIILNKLNNVKIYNIGLGAKESNADILIQKENNCGATQLRYSENGLMSIKTLNSFDYNCHIDFIKIDVEGFEYDVLIGARELILKDKPIIYMEVFPENFNKVSNLLKEFKYYIAESIGTANYICLPDC